MTKVKLTVAGHRAMQKPYVEYDTMKIDTRRQGCGGSGGPGIAEFYLDGNLIGQLDIVSINKGDTLTISGMRGRFELDLL